MKTLNSIFVMLSLFLLTTTSFAQTTINSQKIDSLLSKLSGYDKIYGTIAISQHEKIVYYKRFGNDLANNIEEITNIEYKYRIGSISKMYTAVIIFQLIDENKLTLNTKLSAFFPNVPNADSINIDNLLNHHSGLFSFTNDYNYVNWLTTKKSKEEMLAIIEAEKPIFKPGKKCEYSNTNYVLLGYIIEKITGNSFEDELNKRITKKIGLQNTYYGSKIKKDKNEVKSYEFEENKWKESAETDMSIPGGAGAIVSTPADMTRFIEALLNGKLMSKNSLDSMKIVKGKYGRGIFVKENGGIMSYGHSGAIDGFRSDLFSYPELNLTIAISFNGINYVRQNVTNNIIKIAKGDQVDLNSFNILNLSDEQLAKYEGVFSSKDIPIIIKIKKEANQLTAQATNQSPVNMDAKSETIFEPAMNGAMFEFKKSENGNFNELILKQGGRNLLFTRE